MLQYLQPNKVVPFKQRFKLRAVRRTEYEASEAAEGSLAGVQGERSVLGLRG